MALWDSISAIWGGGTKKPAKVAPTKTGGVAGTAVMAGRVSSPESNPEMSTPEKRYQRYSELLANIDIIAAGVRHFLRLVGGTNWEVTPPKNLMGASEAEAQKHAELVDTILHSMTSSWSSIVAKAALYPFYGFSILEWTAIKRDDGIIGFQDVEVRPQHTVKEWDVDVTGTVLGVIQRSPVDNYEIHYLPRNRIIYAVDQSITDSPEGLGLLRHVATAARYLERYMKIEGIGYDTDLRGIPIARAPLTALKQLVDEGLMKEDEYKARISHLDTFLRNHNRGPELGMMLDSSVYKDQDNRPSAAKAWDLEIIRGDGAGHEHIHEAIKRLMQQIARVLGIEHMLLGGDGSGSLAMSKEKVMMFKMLIDSTLSELAWVFRRDLLTPLWMLNGWDIRTLPDLTPTVLAMRDITELASILETLGKAGFPGGLPGDKAGDYVRAGAGLPPAPEVTAEMLTQLGTFQPPGEEEDEFGAGEDPDGKDPKPKKETEPGRARAAAPPSTPTKK